jgi:crotonobetainyl-CoA:carnitine CoA-transferase CaiB-like acyl-CoA transferase
VVHQKMSERLATSHGQAVGLITQPVRLERTPASIATTAPGWGEHTDEMLAEAGYSAAEVAELKSQGVV